ncbi:MAG: 1-deoxy-D-xylulose-5-phosphate reductoisomerase [Opitutales bacterium]
MKKINLALLGATGSIGKSTLEVTRANPDRLNISSIAGHSNIEKLAEIAKEFNVKHVAIYDEKAYQKALDSGIFGDAKLYLGEDGLTQVSCLDEVDMQVAAVVGTACLRPTIKAIEAGKDIALANKELLVMAGKFVMEAVKKHNVRLLPLDSEHNAIFQCLNGERKCDVASIIITASGGMFREYSFEQMKTITVGQALKHPNWDMGPKVTIDSSTMANKGLEVIEARWLFDMKVEDIEVVVHKQSIVHSMVRFCDGSILGHFSPPSMTFAISHSILYPERGEKVMSGIDFTKAMSLDFAPPNLEKFPCLKYAFDSLIIGETAPCAFNAANEVAVANFIKGKIAWVDISKVVGDCITNMQHIKANCLDDIFIADKNAREFAQNFINNNF